MVVAEAGDQRVPEVLAQPPRLEAPVVGAADPPHVEIRADGQERFAGEHAPDDLPHHGRFLRDHFAIERVPERPPATAIRPPLHGPLTSRTAHPTPDGVSLLPGDRTEDSGGEAGIVGAEVEVPRDRGEMAEVGQLAGVEELFELERPASEAVQVVGDYRVDGTGLNSGEEAFIAWSMLTRRGRDVVVLEDVLRGD